MDDSKLSPEQLRKLKEEEKKKEPKHPFVGLTGSFKRKLMRNATVHRTGTCPKCKAIDSLRFHKDIQVGKNKVEHNKWQCKKCGTIVESNNLINAHSI